MLAWREKIGSNKRYMKLKPKSVTLYHVANHAGVSYQTVSRVINQASHVSEKTRLKVQAAMAALNYVPNRLAQQLAGKLSHTIGLATTNLSLHAPSKVVAAVKSRASQLNVDVMVSMIETPGREACQAAVNSLLAHRVDGVIINIPLEDEDALLIKACCGDTPVLFLDVSPALNASHIIFDPDQGTRLGVELLLALGHRDIALLSGPVSSISARLRHSGWLQHLAAHQITPVAVMYGDWSSMSGYQQVSQLLADGSRASAILVANDQMALGTLRALAEYGLSVPDTVSVIGYDDTEDSACFTPPLTTIKHDFSVLGNTSVDLLFSLIKGENKASVVLPVSLIKRKTTVAPGKTEPSPQQLADQLRRLAGQISRLI